jgi:hypothetical protein
LATGVDADTQSAAGKLVHASALALSTALSDWRVWGVRSLRDGVDHSGLIDAATSLYRGHRFPVEIISHCVWLYHRFPLSLRDVEEMMAERGVSVSYDTIVRHEAPGNRAGVRDLRRRSVAAVR